MDTVPNTQLPSQTYSQKTFPKRQFLLTLTIWFIIMLTGVVLIYLLKENNKIPPSITKIYGNTYQPKLHDEKSFYIYQDTKDSSLLGYGVFYNFNGNIKSIQPISGGSQIILNIEDPALPKIILTPKTKVFFGYNHFNYTGMGTTSDIKENLYVKLVVYYSISRNTWVLAEAYIPEKNK